jgi:hypothetical protein
LHKDKNFSAFKKVYNALTRYPHFNAELGISLTKTHADDNHFDCKSTKNLADILPCICLVKDSILKTTNPHEMGRYPKADRCELPRAWHC